MSPRFLLRGPQGYVKAGAEGDWTSFAEEAYYWLDNDAAHAARRRYQNYHRTPLTVVVREHTHPFMEVTHGHH